MARLPTGTVTFLYTDVVGSTRLVQQLGDRYPEALAAYRRLIHSAVEERNGFELDLQGDACLIAFSRGEDALAAAVAAQRALRGFPWPEGAALNARMGLHTGEPRIVGTEYIGIDVHRAARIGMAGHAGQILLSETTHALVRDRLPEATGVRDLGEHHLKDLTGPQRLFQVVAAGLPSAFPPLQSPDMVPNNLPVQLTSFVGREREIADLKRALGTARLLTLAGAGGAGKTRLALEVATEVLKEFPDGVWLVELAACSEPALVPETVASALNVAEHPSAPIVATLSNFLQNRHLLLVLDNCEHLVAACAELANALLRTCPHLRIFTTSREPLRIAGETVYPVRPLALPEFERLSVAENLIKYEGIRLFVERAVAALPSFTPTDQNAPEITRVCSRLDGLPLALELAAARVSGLSVEQIAAKLDDRFRLLTRGSRTALPHHQTLRAALDWSFNLLSEPEKVVFRRLAVFSGGFTLEAAEAVCAGSGVEKSEVLDLLAHLADKSLLMFEVLSGEARYRLLETVRQYGLDRLLEAAEVADVRRRHRDWYLGLAEQAETAFHGAAQSSWFRRLEVEHDNFREALKWSGEEENDEAGLRLVAALHWFWLVRGHLGEARAWLGRVLSTSTGATVSRAKALYAAGSLANAQRDYEQATALGEVSLAMSQALGDRRSTAQALHLLGQISMGCGDYGAAKVRFEQCLLLFRESGDKRGISISLNNLGEVARCQGDYATARARYEEDIVVARELGHERGIGISLHNLGYVAHALGDFQRAKALFRESLAIRVKLGHKAGIAYCFAGLARVAGSQNQFERAARLLGATDALLSGIGAHLDEADRPEYERAVDLARAGLGEAAFEVARDEGRMLRLEGAVEYALST